VQVIGRKTQTAIVGDVAVQSHSETGAQAMNTAALSRLWTARDDDGRKERTKRNEINGDTLSAGISRGDKHGSIRVLLDHVITRFLPSFNRLSHERWRVSGQKSLSEAAGQTRTSWTLSDVSIESDQYIAGHLCRLMSGRLPFQELISEAVPVYHT